MAHPVFVIKKSPEGQFFFNLTAKNGQVLMTSEYYMSRLGCEAAIENVRNYAMVAQVHDTSGVPGDTLLRVNAPQAGGGSNTRAA